MGTVHSLTWRAICYPFIACLSPVCKLHLSNSGETGDASSSQRQLLSITNLGVDLNLLTGGRIREEVGHRVNSSSPRMDSRKACLLFAWQIDSWGTYVDLCLSSSPCRQDVRSIVT